MKRERRPRSTRSALAISICGLAAVVARACWVGSPVAAAEAQPHAAQRLAVLELELTGDTGGPGMSAEHQKRLATQTERLRQEIARTGLYQLVDLGPAQPLIDRLRSQQAYLHDCNGCDLEIGRALHADAVMVEWVDRVSGLILSLTYEIHDVASGQIAARKSFDFRGDNDASWTHAVTYMVRDLKENPPPR